MDILKASFWKIMKSDFRHRGVCPAFLDERLWFPDPNKAVPEGELKGLVAVGGDLSVERLLLAYRSGLFPWSADPITWWSPDPRGVLDLDEIHLPRSLAKVIRRNEFTVTFNQNFREVMRACAETRREETWIDPEFLAAYGALHDAGHAVSLECWKDGALAGGIYGVRIGRYFAGESMFHRVTNASKVALYHLAVRLKQEGCELFDIQMVTSVTRLMGGKEISRSEFLKRLSKAIV
jgi:leucyl/phenylalanyl-tRNA---protein transferase